MNNKAPKHAQASGCILILVLIALFLLAMTLGLIGPFYVHTIATVVAR